MLKGKICKYFNLLGSFLLLTPSALWALSTDRDQPLDVDANSAHFEQNKQIPGASIIYLKGNVKLHQGSLKAHADEATAYQEEKQSTKTESGESKINRILMMGKPAHLEQIEDDDRGLITADAQTIDYKVASDTIELTGNVVVIQASRGEFRSEHMIYNTKTGEMQGGDDRPEGRVHIRMMPKKSNSTSEKDKVKTDKPSAPKQLDKKPLGKTTDQ